MNSTLFSNYSCRYRPNVMVPTRFYLVVVFGTAVSAIAFVENILLFISFVSRWRNRHSHVVYLTFLAFFDIFISIAYVMLMSVNVLIDYLYSPELLKAWFSYMVPILTVSHCFITASSYLILAAVAEQYLIASRHPLTRMARRFRLQLCAFSIMIGLVTKGTILFEFQIRHRRRCVGTMAEYGLGLSRLAVGYYYHTFWRFWFRHVVTIFLPFFLVAYFNVRTVVHLTAQRNAINANENSERSSIVSALMWNPASMRRRSSIILTIQKRTATRMFIWITLTYLISNSFNIVVTAWEHLDYDGLKNKFGKFYAFSNDIVSLLKVLACAFRLPIYCYCRAEIRRDLFATLRRYSRRGRRRRLPRNRRARSHHTSSQSQGLRSSTNPELSSTTQSRLLVNISNGCYRRDPRRVSWNPTASDHSAEEKSTGSNDSKEIIWV